MVRVVEHISEVDTPVRAAVSDRAVTQKEGHMTQKDTLVGIEQAVHGVAATQKTHGDQLRMLAERQEEIIKLLTPEPKDGPTLDELMGHIIGQLTELIGYARQNVKMQAQMEQSLPGDVVRALASDAVSQPAGNGAARGSRA